MHEKYIEYAGLITGAIGQMLLLDDSEYHIDQEELLKDDNMTHFIHALANVASTHIYNELTGDNLNHLDFNHIANKLCFQYMNKVD